MLLVAALSFEEVDSYRSRGLSRADVDPINQKQHMSAA